MTRSATHRHRRRFAGHDLISYGTAKRVFDLVVASVLLLGTLPLLIMIGWLVAATSPGPILFRQQRCGRDGRLFTCYKFRSMVAEAEVMRVALIALNEVSGPVFKVRRDPRLTTVGRWLRKLSIDELPQLINVLRGEMSIVGPRPPLLAEVAQYTPYQRRRLTVTPGLTCLWQIAGRSQIGFDEWVELDLEYIERRGFWFDLGIVLRTVPVVLIGRGAY